jgi:cytochrome P450
MEPLIRSTCQRLIDRIIDTGRGQCEFFSQFSLLFPTTIFLGLMGLPLERGEEFVDLAHRWNRPTSPEDRFHVEKKIDAALLEAFVAARSNPRDDVASYIANCDFEGRHLDEKELLGIGRLMFIAGLDTVASTLGWMFKHLAENPHDRRRITEQGDVIPSAVEEFLRYYSILLNFRTLTDDAELGGRHMRKGDTVAISLAPANRDPEAFPNPDEFVMDRSPNRHMGFGLGPHRCVGSHLARLELAIALEEWHKRIPDYRLAQGSEPTVTRGPFVTSLDSLQLTWS